MVNTITHANGVAVTYVKDDFDQRRPKSVSTTGASTNWSSGTYGYDGAGNVKAVGTDWHTYDLVSRLTGGSFAAWGQGTRTHGASYNAFGFMLTLVTNGATQSFTPDLSGANNHISGVAYDGAGNMAGWGGYTYTWDRVNQLTGLAGTGIGQHAYLYTADGERIVDREVNGGTTTVKLWVRGLDAKVLREYTRSGSTWSWTKDYAYREGLLLASVDSTETRHFAFDHLGTPRLTTGPAGAVRAGHTYYPFGMEASDPCGDAERMKFTGHERDQHGNCSTQTDDLDYMHARYYNPSIGRFLSVDPGRDAEPASPQAWNTYSYVRGDPLTLTDPNGRWIALAAGAGSAEVRKILVLTAMRPTGRETLKGFATDKMFLLRFNNARLNSPAQMAAALKSHSPNTVTLGQTQTQAKGGVITGASVQLDVAAIHQLAPDKTGVATTVHEMYHANDIRSGKSYAELKAGDEPPNGAGPASQAGRAVAAEKPDISEKEAEELVKQFLSQGPPEERSTSDSKSP